MVFSADLIEIIESKLKEHKAKNIVADPVMVATSGARLLTEDAAQALQEKLLPLATLITPNLPEAEALTGMEIHSKADMEKAARLLQEKTGASVLCKGGHRFEDADDLLLSGEEITWLRERHIENPNTHGTGCTLSAAIAAYLAKGENLPAAVQKAKAYVTGALQAGLDLGHGSGPLHHGWNLTQKA